MNSYARLHVPAGVHVDHNSSVYSKIRTSIYPVKVRHHAVGTARTRHPVETGTVRAVVARRAIVITRCWVTRCDVFRETVEAVWANLALP